jgi:hypothetical protein
LGLQGEVKQEKASKKKTNLRENFKLILGLSARMGLRKRERAAKEES